MVGRLLLLLSDSYLFFSDDILDPASKKIIAIARLIFLVRYGWVICFTDENSAKPIHFDASLIRKNFLCFLGDPEWLQKNTSGYF